MAWNLLYMSKNTLTVLSYNVRGLKEKQKNDGLCIISSDKIVN